MVEEIKNIIKNLRVNWVNASDIDFVTVRQYDGDDKNQHVWTFLGYDIVERKKDKAKSLTLDDIDYRYLSKLDGTISPMGRTLYNHDDIEVGDIRVKSDDLLDIKSMVDKIKANYKCKYGEDGSIFVSKKGIRSYASNNSLPFYKNKQYIKK